MIDDPQAGIRPPTDPPAAPVVSPDGGVRIARAVAGPASAVDYSRRRRQLIALIVSLVALVAVFVGVGVYGVAQMVRLIEQESQPRTLNSKDPPASITLPAGWSEVTDLAGEAMFQARSLDQQTYVLVTETPKEDLADGMTLEGFSKLTFDWTQEGMTNTLVDEAAHMDRGGRSFIQTKIQGEVDQQKTVIQQAVTEDSKRFYSIQLGTVPSEYSAVSAAMEAIIASFKLLGPDGTPSSSPTEPGE